MRSSSLLPGLILILLQACATSPQVGEQPTDTSLLSIKEQIQQLMYSANNSSGRAAQVYQLQAIELLLQQQQHILAKQLLQNVDQSLLDGESLGRYHVLLSRIELDEGHADQVLLRLNDPALLARMDSMPLPLQIELSDLRARALGLTGNHLASARERIFIAPLLVDEEHIQQNRRELWQSLMYLGKSELQEYLPSAVSEDYRGWLELAIISKSTHASLEQQIEQLHDWQARWQGHPAAQQLPQSLTLLEELLANRPRKVALLLPFSGKHAAVSASIRDGFLAAAYQNTANAPEILLYDTDNDTQVEARFYQARADGAEVIIGPLTKNGVKQMMDMPDLTVPVLALNYVDDYGYPPQQLFQFGLSARDEAIQMARTARLENHRNALILNPANEWGEKNSEAFATEWTALGGHVIGQGSFSQRSDYAPLIKDMFNLEASETRARSLRQLIGRKFEFEPRRRQDIDMIFLLARPAQARSINPMFSFLYGGDIPVYATSHIYSGSPNPDKDSDLNDIKFSEIPWIIEPDNPLRLSLEDAGIKSTSPYLRMYALGVDAFHLHTRLIQLEKLPESPVYGETGILSLGDNRHITRLSRWATIRNGRAIPLPHIAYNPSLQVQPTGTTELKQDRSGDLHDFWSDEQTE